MNPFHYAAMLIQKVGWEKGAFETPFGFCMVGALRRALLRPQGEVGYSIAFKFADAFMRTNYAEQLVLERKSVLVADDHETTMITYNDRVAGGGKDVIRVLNEMGDAWDAEHPTHESLPPAPVELSAAERFYATEPVKELVVKELVTA